MYGELVSSPVSGLSDVGDLDYMIPPCSGVLLFAVFFSVWWSEGIIAAMGEVFLQLCCSCVKGLI